MSTLVIGKDDKQREVYFSISVMYHLGKYIKGRNDNCEALMVTERKPYRRLTKRGIQRKVDIIAQKAGLQDNKVSPHVLRHTFATLTLNNGAELVAIQELLGHSSPDTTLRYAKITHGESESSIKSISFSKLLFI
ncbi:tyrosine-type recombinase/integrase [Niallia circulans]|uniref:tyrosine-type recombinase/integrase n=1 Tax=Niallia circulans TaxID=1397 RepID=UPI001CFFC599|nr:tyrosine-type recombinase/integrase [Niallia circulans]MCB5236551.1 tyrosine-type recombinase/integrase [Niallia circulans]